MKKSVTHHNTCCSRVSKDNSTKSNERRDAQENQLITREHSQMQGDILFWPGMSTQRILCLSVQYVT